jgi:entericidin B
MSGAHNPPAANLNQRRKDMLRKILVLALLSGVLGAVTGCNTMSGVGRDIERGGEKIQDKANR